MTSLAERTEQVNRAAAAPSAFGLNLATILVLWRRDIVRFFRQKTRVIGALAQPVMFWFIIGGGLSGTFSVPGAAGVGYQEYFFPGVVLMVVLFTSIFSTMSVIEDRHAGFLQAVLVAPSSRVSIVLGKTLGGVTVALIQAALFLVMLPWAGFHAARVDWPLLAVILLLMSIALTSLGFALAWWIDSTQGYHAIMFVLLIPAWVLSGAMFPVERSSRWLTAIMRFNPVTYGVEGCRRALYGGLLPHGVGVSGSSAALELGVAGAFAAVTLLLAAAACSRQA